MLLAPQVAAASAGGLDMANLEFWVVLTNVAIVVATLMLTRVTAKDAMLHEERMADKASETTHDLTEIVHDVLVQEGRLLADGEGRAAAADDPTPLRAVQ